MTHMLSCYSHMTRGLSILAKLLVNINMFSLNQNIFIEEHGEIKPVASVPMDQISDLIITFKDVEEIEIDGNQKFIEKIGMEVLEKYKQKYSNSNVRFKLNGKVFN